MEEGKIKLGGNKPETNTPRPAVNPVGFAGRRNADVLNNRGRKMIIDGIEISVSRTEQWEHTAFGWGMKAVSYGETDAVAKLLVKRVKQLEKALVRVGEHSLENDYCFSCDNHISSGHSPDCPLKDFTEN